MLEPFAGDACYSINCTGYVVKGDAISFSKASFSGSFRNARFNGYETFTGYVERESYGKDKQQHTFTIRLSEGTLMRIKGRVLYREGVYRMPWPDESERHKVADEKHKRGDAASEQARIRKEFQFN